MTTKDKNLKLIYVNTVGQQWSGEYRYEFFFSEEPYNIDFNDNWKRQFAGLADDMLPYKDSYCEVKHLTTSKRLTCAQSNMCYPFMYAVYGITAVCFESLEGLEEYPEPFRLVLHYGDSYEDIVSKMEELELKFDEDITI